MNHRKHPNVPEILPSRDLEAFGGSLVQRILHNELTSRWLTAHQNLEKFSGDDLVREQGIALGLQVGLETLHRRDSIAVRKDFGYE